MNWRSLFKTIGAAVGSGAFTAVEPVWHSYRSGETVNIRRVAILAAGGAAFGLWNLFLHPPGGTKTVTETINPPNELKITTKSE